MFIQFLNYATSIVINYKSVSKRSCIFITVIMQIRTFSLNFGTSFTLLSNLKYFIGECPSHIETSQLIGFYVRGTLTVKELNTSVIIDRESPTKISLRIEESIYTEMNLKVQ